MVDCIKGLRKVKRGTRQPHGHRSERCYYSRNGPHQKQSKRKQKREGKRRPRTRPDQKTIHDDPYGERESTWNSRTENLATGTADAIVPQVSSLVQPEVKNISLHMVLIQRPKRREALPPEHPEVNQPEAGYRQNNDQSMVKLSSSHRARRRTGPRGHRATKQKIRSRIRWISETTRSEGRDVKLSEGEGAEDFIHAIKEIATRAGGPARERGNIVVASPS